MTQDDFQALLRRFCAAAEAGDGQAFAACFTPDGKTMFLSIQHPGTRFSRRYSDLDAKLRDQVCALVRALRDRKLAFYGLDWMAVGEVLFNNLNMMFIEFVISEMSIEALKTAVDRQNAPIAQMISQN